MQKRCLKHSSVLCIVIILLFAFSHALFSQMIPDEAIELKVKGDNARDIRQAINFYEEALRVYPDFPEVIYDLGVIYDRDLGELVNAVYYYKRYLEIDPQGPLAKEVLSLLRGAERGIEQKRIESGITPDTIDSRSGRRGQRRQPPEMKPPEMPVAEPPPPSPQSQVDVSGPLTEDVINITIQEKVYKYYLKLDVWEREGFIERFNQLANMRRSPLEYDVAGEREALRQERIRVTEFIDYREEAVKFLLRKAVLEGIKSLGMELDHLPKDIVPEEFVNSQHITDIKDDSRFVDITLTASLDKRALEVFLLSRGYIFKPNRLTIILQGVSRTVAEALTDKIAKVSDFVGPISGGLYSVYTTPQNFKNEMEQKSIGKYRFYLVSIGTNSITFQVYSESEYR